MATLGSLSVNLLANLNPFEKGMKKGKKAVTGFSKHVQKAAGIIGAAFATQRVVSGFSRLSEEMDALAKTSRRLGLTAGRLQAYYDAAEHAGVTTEQMGKSLEFLQARIGAALTGAAEEQKIFERLGLDPKTLAEMKDPLQEVGNSILQLGTIAERTRTFRQLTGESGARMMNLFENAIGKTNDELTHNVHKIEEMNDAWTDAMQTMETAGRGMVLAIAPLLTEVFKKMETSISWAMRQTHKSLDLITSEFREAHKRDTFSYWINQGIEAMMPERMRGGTLWEKASAFSDFARIRMSGRGGFYVPPGSRGQSQAEYDADTVEMQREDVGMRRLHAEMDFRAGMSGMGNNKATRHLESIDAKLAGEAGI